MRRADGAIRLRPRSRTRHTAGVSCPTGAATPVRRHVIRRLRPRTRDTSYGGGLAGVRRGYGGQPALQLKVSQ